MMLTHKVDNLEVFILPNREIMGKAAAQAGAKHLRGLLKTQDEVNVVFAAAPSQEEMMAALINEEDIDWGRVNALHMDNYIALPDSAPQQFSNFLRIRLFRKLPFRSIHTMGNQGDSAEQYAAILKQFPPDVCFMGIGENGNIAFNDPINAHFDDPLPVKRVELDYACRMQQVNEGNFASLEQVPTHAVTLTIPTLMGCKAIVCTVPGRNKARAIVKVVEEDITEECPASILRRHPEASLYLDKEAASLLTNL